MSCVVAVVQSKLGEQELVNRGEIKDSLKEHIDGLKEEFLAAYSGSSGRDDGTGAPKLPNFIQFKQDMGAFSFSS